MLLLSIQTITLISNLTPGNLLEEEGGMSGEETDTEHEPDQVTSERQNFWETVRGVRSYIGWNQVPEFKSSASSQDDNPMTGFAKK